MPDQKQPNKQLIKTWSDWESGIGFLPDDYSHGETTEGMYFADGVLGIHGELRPAPIHRQAPIKSHIIRRLYNDNTEAAAIALQVLSTGADANQPSIKNMKTEQGTTASVGAEFTVGSFVKQGTNGAQAVAHGATNTPQGILLWSSDGDRDGADGAVETGKSNFIGITDGTTDRCVSWNSEDSAGGAPTAVTENALEAGSDTGTVSTVTHVHIMNTTHGGPSFTSWGPWLGVSANKLYLAAIMTKSAVSASIPTTFEGANQTWVQVETIAYGSAYRLTLYRCMPTSSDSGWMNIEWADEQTDGSITVSEFSNTITGNNGADAIIQSQTGNSRTASSTFAVTLNPFTTSGNATYGTAWHNNGGGITPGSGFTEIIEQSLGSTKHQTEWRNDDNGTPSADWSSSSGVWTGIGVEIGAKTTAKTSFTTGTFQPTTNRLILVSVDSYINGGTAESPSSLSGNGQTWVKVDEQAYDSNQRMVSIWRALDTGTPSSGAMTITFTTAHDSCRWAISEFDNVTTTNNGADAVVRSGSSSGTGTTPLHTFTGAHGDANGNNATFGAFGADIETAFTAGTNFTEIWEVQNDGTLATEWYNDEDLTVDGTITSADWGAIAVEIEFWTGASNSSNTARRYANAAISVVDFDAGASPPEATVTSIDGTNINFNWTNNNSKTEIIHFMCFGGADVSADVSEWTANTSVGTQAVTGVGLKPTCVINIGALLTAAGSSADIKVLFGVSDGTNEFAQVFQSLDGFDPTSTSSRTTISNCLENIDGTSTSTIDSFDSDGFTLRHNNAWFAGYKFATLSLNGITAEAGQFTKKTSTGDESATSIGITSDAFILTSSHTTSNDSTTNHAAFAMGAASETTETAASAWTDEHNVSPADVYAWHADGDATTGGEQVVFEEIGIDDGAENAVGGIKNMDIGAAAWIDWDSPDSQDASKATLINYIGFTASSDPKLTHSSFDTTITSGVTATQLIVAIAIDKTATINSVTFNGNESLTKYISADDTTNYSLEIWYRANPSTDTTGDVVITTSAAKDIIAGIWFIEDAAGDLGNTDTFQNNDVDDGDYISVGVEFNQPDASGGTQDLKLKDLILGVSVDGSAVKDSGTADAAVTYTATGMTDTRESLATNVYKQYTLTGTTKKSSMSIDTNTATVFTAHSNGWGNGTPTSGGAGDAWQISGTSVSSLETISWDLYESSMHMIGTYLDTPYHKWVAHYYLDESIAADDQYAYIIRGRPIDTADTPPDSISDPPVIVSKIDLRYGSDGSGFGDELGVYEFTDLTYPGQVARYQGNWFFPSAGTSNPRKLIVGTGTIDADTLTGITDAGANTVEHIANSGFKLAGHRSSSGWRATILDGDPTDEADWGSYFEAGDKNERANGLASVAGADFFMNVEGLWSYFLDTGRSALEFEDFRIWRNLFSNIPISPWRGGLIIPHPSGLLFWSPGTLPTNIGFDARTASFADPPTNITNYNRGRYLGTVGVGDYIYTLYQPDITTAEVYIMCGYLRRAVGPEEIVWQSLGKTYLYDPDYSANVGVVLQGKPLSADYETPTLWFNNGNDLRYIYLDDRAGPFRSTRKVAQSGWALMPELFFPERHDLSEIIIYTQGMRTGDSWKVSMFADNGAETNLGAPIINNGRTVIKIDRHNVYRAMFKLTWSSSNNDETLTESPAIKRIELYGRATTRGA